MWSKRNRMKWILGRHFSRLVTGLLHSNGKNVSSGIMFLRREVISKGLHIYTLKWNCSTKMFLLFKNAKITKVDKTYVFGESLVVTVGGDNPVLNNAFCDDL